MPICEFDAIIVGAGHNSLACASHLVTKGWRVLVLERAEVAGGAIKTGEYTDPGFHHDWAAMNLSLFRGSEFFKKYGQDLILNGLEFVPVSNCFASVFPDKKWLGISNDPVINMDRISAFSLKDKKTWEEMTEAFPSDSSHIFKLLGSKMRFKSLAFLLLSLIRKKGFGGSVDFIRFLLMSPRAWLDKNFESSHLKATLAAWGLHLDFAPDIAGGALFSYLEAMTNQSFGMVIGKSGADNIVKSMVKYIELKGGSLLCKSEVVEIIHNEGRANGVKLLDGSIINAKRCVIANLSPSALIRLTKGINNHRYTEVMSKFKHAPGTLMIHLSMKELPDWKAGNELKNFAYVHIAPSMEQMAKTYQQAVEGLLPDQPVIVVGQPTAVDPSRSPVGKHILWVQVRMAPGIIKGDSKKEISETDWSKAKEAFAQRAINIIEEYAPNTREKIISYTIVSPIDLELDNPNLVLGDQICGSHHLTQNFIFRPVRGYSTGKTPIQDLYHTGAAVWPGGGTGAGSGYLLGRMLAGD